MNKAIWPLMGIILLTIVVGVSAQVKDKKRPENFDGKCTQVLQKSGLTGDVYECVIDKATCYVYVGRGISCLKL